MSDILCVTNRRLCGEDFLQRIERIAACRPAGIILREKDLTERQYYELAAGVMNICKEYDVPCILHSFAGAAAALSAEAIHMPLPILSEMSAEEKAAFKVIGASCHSRGEAARAERLGCSYITAGHVFETDCKKDLPPGGISFLKEVCDAVSVPVFGIGGINGGNIGSVRSAGAAGACIMSGLMKCSDPAEFLDKLQRR